MFCRFYLTQQTPFPHFLLLLLLIIIIITDRHYYRQSISQNSCIPCYGNSQGDQNQIPTGTAPPIHERYRPVPPTLYPELRKLLQSTLDYGVMQESLITWAATIVVRKNCKKERWITICEKVKPFSPPGKGLVYWFSLTCILNISPWYMVWPNGP